MALSFSNAHASSNLALRAAASMALAGSLMALASCGARTELMRPEPCTHEGEQLPCRGYCGPGERVCRDGFWSDCEIPPTTEPCSDICGTGLRTCENAAWGACVVPVAERQCSDACGQGTEQCVDGAWGLCVVPPVDKPCLSACGDGVEHCENGIWVPCNARQPKPPTLTATVRDFLDTHPDFEHAIGDDRGIVKSTLGPDDKPVYAAGDAGTLTTTGPKDFDQWYNDVPGVNETTQIQLKFETVADKPNQFRYSSSDFFPIDGQLFGNQGRPHNYHFTLEIATSFRYVGGETFTFSGDDDVWVFINRQLAIDLGGVHVRETAEVNLDDNRSRFGISVGETYPLHIFFAERHTVASDFEVDTEVAFGPSCQ